MSIGKTLAHKAVQALSNHPEQLSTIETRETS